MGLGATSQGPGGDMALSREINVAKIINQVHFLIEIIEKRYLGISNNTIDGNRRKACVVLINTPFTIHSTSDSQLVDILMEELEGTFNYYFAQ